MSDAVCSHCGAAFLIRAGRNRSGRQRWQCRACGRYTTLTPKEHGYSKETREQAVRLYMEGMSLRGTGRCLGVVHQTVAHWVAEAAQVLPVQVADTAASDTIEVNELETCVGGKGVDASVIVAVARETRQVVGAWVTRVVDWVGTQLFADTLPAAQRFCTDGATVYPVIMWPEPRTHVAVRTLRKHALRLSGGRSPRGGSHPRRRASR